MTALALINTIRDEDLLKRLAATPEMGREFVYKRCVDEQARRDKLAALPRDQRRRATTRHLIEELKGGDRENLGHLHSVLAICSMPYSRQPIHIRDWERKQGKMSLMLTAGQLMTPDGTWKLQPLPYGSRARLLMLHTCSQAILQNSRTIDIEDSLSAFIRSMGFPVTGGKNGTLQSFRQQINALAACTMSIGMWDHSQAKTFSTQPFSSINVWLNGAENQRSLWPQTVTFTQEFYDTLVKHALPVNMHAVRAFAGSPRKLDILFWLGYRLHSITKPTPISWNALREQFGTGYIRERRFRSDLAAEIAEIREVFPKLPVKITDFGFVISPGSTEVLAIPTIKRK